MIPNTTANLKVFLSGAFDDTIDAVSNKLRTLNLIPTNQPYIDSHFSWQGNETVNVNNLKNDLVDWVLVTVRNPYTNAYVSSKAGILKTDGNIIDPEHSISGDNTAGLTLPGISNVGKYKIVIQHRNHIGVATFAAISITPGSPFNLDFTTNTRVNPSSQITIGTVGTAMVYGLRSGDITNDGIIDAADRNVIGNTNEVDHVYDAKDVNNDGAVDAIDRNIIFNSNEIQENIDSTISSTTASSVSSQPITSLPLGDGKIGLNSQVGYVKACSLNFPPVGGAFSDGPWIKSNGTWDPSIKIAIQGSIIQPNHTYSINLNSANNTRIISTNDIPDHPTGVFPVASTDPAYNFDRNPNTITPQNIVKSLSVNPTICI